MRDKYILTAESVTEGHPDKLCDTIADSVLDACLRDDPAAQVACEVMATAGKIIVAGEITARELPDIAAIVCRTVWETGYHCDYEVEAITHDQSGDIAGAVSQEAQMGAGDQGIMYGYACSETPQLLPLPVVLAHRLTALLTKSRKLGAIYGLGPDGKAQVSVEYRDGKPARIAAIIVSCQHDEDKSPEELRQEIMQCVIAPAFQEIAPDRNTEVLINPSGRFVLGGFEADTGLTGRKLMLSLPEDWDYTLSGLARISLEGKDAIRAAVVELEKAGYVQRRQTTDKKGKFASNEYIIREYPVSHEPPPEGPSSANPLSENPTTEKPSTENTTQINKDKKITDPQITESFPFPSSPSTSPAPGAAPIEAKGKKPGKRKVVSKDEMDAYREMIHENICYDDFVREHPYDAGQLDEMVELMVEAVCSNKKTIRVAGNDFPQAVVKSRLLKLNSEHIRFVFDCLRENTTQVRNMKQYLLTVLYNAPATIENHYAAQVNYDLYGEGSAA